MTIRSVKTRALGIAALAATFALAAPLAAQAQEADFSGQTVEVMVNFAAGGATDSAARLIAPYIARNLPGNPSLIVTNRGGAGGTAAVDYLINSVAPDGMTIGYFSGTALRWALDVDQVPAGTGDLNYVAGKSVNNILVVRADSGLTFDSYQGFGEPIFFALNSPDNHIAIRMRLFSEAMGVERFELISGYDTQGRMIAAVRSDEVTMAQANDTFFGSNRTALEGDGVLAVLGQLGEYRQGAIMPQDGLEDIPVLDTLWREKAPETLDSAEYRVWQALHQAMAVQNVFVLPTETPAEFVDAWEAAILAAYDDPEYLAQITEVGLPNASSTDAAGLRALMAEMRSAFDDPQVTAVIEAAISRNMQ